MWKGNRVTPHLDECPQDTFSKEIELNVEGHCSSKEHSYHKHRSWPTKRNRSNQIQTSLEEMQCTRMCCNRLRANEAAQAFFEINFQIETLPNPSRILQPCDTFLCANKHKRYPHQLLIELDVK